MIVLKGIYKYPGYGDLYGFEQWVKKTNPNIILRIGTDYKVSMAFKQGKRRKLKKRTVRLSGGCECCGTWLTIN